MRGWKGTRRIRELLLLLLLFLGGKFRSGKVEVDFAFRFWTREGCVHVCSSNSISPLPNCFRCFRSRSRLVRRKFGLMVGGLSRMFRIFNGRIKEGRIGEGEKVFYLGAIKGVEGFLNGRTRLDFRWVKRRRRRKRRGSFVIQRTRGDASRPFS